MRSSLYRWSWAVLDLLFPPNCGGCDKPGERWCLECRKNTRRIESPYCDLCGQTLGPGANCTHCVSSKPGLTAIRSWAIFEGPIRNAMHRVKYANDLALAGTIAQELSQFLMNLGWDLDIIVPVPLSKQRQKERGYNQAALLAKPLAWNIGKTYYPQALRRTRDTVSQVGLNLNQRKENVSGAFLAHPNRVTGKNILLVDDVATSGSTLNACADALWIVGAKRVYGLTLTRAVQSS